jgi:xylulokinase
MYLGIDIGTSAVKAVIASPEGWEISNCSEPLSLDIPVRNWSEQRPEIWWEATRKVCGMLRRNRPRDWKDIKGIGLSGQMHGAVLLDREFAVIRPAILWNDGRSAQQCRTLEERLPDIAGLCGVPAMPGMTAPKIMWVREFEPENYARIRHVLLPKDFVRLQLTGETATDMVDASGTMWFDTGKRRWSPLLCDISDTDPSWLPVCYEGTEISGELTSKAAKMLGLGPGIPVAAGAGDAAAGAIGIGAVEDGDTFVSLGTSSQLFVSTACYQPDAGRTVHAFAHGVPGRWSMIAAMLNGAAPMSWLASILKSDISILLEEAQDARPDAVPHFLPYLTGERTPHNDPSIRGAFYGLDAGMGRSALMRAVVDAIAYTLCDGRDSIESAGRSIRMPGAIGGGTRSDYVLQTVSDAMELPIQRYQGARTGPALGAARLAMIASGGAGLDAAAIKPETDRIFEPDVTMADYHRDRLATFRALYHALKRVRL